MKRTMESSRKIVGISSRCPQDQFQWMIDMLTSHLSELVSEVKYLPITNENSDEWKKEVKRYSIGILYHSLKHGRINITDVEGSLYDKELSYMSQCLDKENVMVVLDDLDHAKVEEKERILRTQPSIKDCSSLLLLIANKDKQSGFLSQIDAISQLLNTVKHQSSMGNFPAKNHGRSKQTHSSDDGASLESSRKNLKLDIPCSQKHSVGVFSRCAKINYKWLVVKLESKAFGSLVKEVHAVEISNDVSHFLSAVNNCTFAILYHSQNHGRLNIIGVADSLYDRELKTLFQSFGKKKVIVVIDDLKDSSAEVKRNILHEQKSIEQFSQELLLFSETEKARINTSDTVYSKLEKLKQILETSCEFTEKRAQPSMTPVAAERVSAQQLMLNIEDLKKEMSNQTQQIKDLKNGMSNQTQHIEDLKKEMSNKTQHIEDLKKEMSNQTQHIEDLKKEMSNKTQHIEDLKKEMSNQTQKTEELKKELPNQAQQIDKLNKEVFQQSQL